MQYDRIVPWIAVAAALCFPVTASGQLQFAGVDNVTQGNWLDVYGECFYAIAGSRSNIIAYEYGIVNGASIRFDIVGGSRLDDVAYSVWTYPEDDPRVLEDDSGILRHATTLYGALTCGVTLTGLPAGSYRVAIYMLDWDYSGRSQTVTVSNPRGQSATGSFNAFGQGQYGLFDVNVIGPGEPVTILAAKTGPSNAVITGVFLDPIPAVPDISFAGTDTSTQGEWLGVYGASFVWLPGFRIGSRFTNSAPDSGPVMNDARDLLHGSLFPGVIYDSTGGRYSHTDWFGKYLGNAYAYVWKDSPSDMNLC